MTDDTSVTETNTDADEQESTEQSAEVEHPGEQALGDAGKKALDAMKAKWKDADATAKRATQELADLRAKDEGREAEHQAAQEAQKVKDDALAVANLRILKAEVRAAAAGKLQDPADALRYIEDLSAFEVGADGEVDGDAIRSAIDDLIGTKPYLAAQGGPRFQGSGDGGPRKAEPPKSLDEEIAEAEKAGDWPKARQLKVRKLTDPPQNA